MRSDEWKLATTQPIHICMTSDCKRDWDKIKWKITAGYIRILDFVWMEYLDWAFVLTTILQTHTCVSIRWMLCNAVATNMHWFDWCCRWNAKFVTLAHVYHITEMENDTWLFWIGKFKLEMKVFSATFGFGFCTSVQNFKRFQIFSSRWI